MKLPRNAQIWLPDYLAGGWRKLSRPAAGTGRVWLSICDHYEPLGVENNETNARARVAAWRDKWPRIAGRHRDSLNQPPRYTFFYPQEEYRHFLVEPLAEMTREGIADVEVHIHHDEKRDPQKGMGRFPERMSSFVELLHRDHGLLRRDASGALRFGFIHGNWALDNSRPDGAWCGLNDEISLLKRLGCYADFTMPSGASPTQSRTLNRVYRAVDDPNQPRSHDTGIPVAPGSGDGGDLLMIPGPFALRWRERALPRLETGELAGNDHPSAYRWQRWLDVAPVVGREIILKLYTHGGQDRNLSPLLDSILDNLFQLGASECARRGYELRFASAWETAQAVEAAARGTPLP